MSLFASWRSDYIESLTTQRCKSKQCNGSENGYRNGYRKGVHRSTRAGTLRYRAGPEVVRNNSETSDLEQDKKEGSRA